MNDTIDKSVLKEAINKTEKYFLRYSNHQYVTLYVKKLKKELGLGEQE
jgi:tRNA nucleotidyltransferase (CCA-adding enzyme)